MKRQLELRLRSLFRRERVEQELDEELQYHLDRQTEANIVAGMKPDEARYAARRAFGDVTQRAEECRDARRMTVIENLVQDLRYAWRGMRRDPMLAIAAALTLAIAIGANTTVFSLVNSILLRPLPYPNSERIYWVAERMGRDQSTVALDADYYSLREQNRVFEDVAAYDHDTLNWTGVDRPEQVDAAPVTPSFFRVMGIQPMLGRTLAENEQGSKAPKVAVLSFAFWRSRMASDSRAVGKTITFDGVPATIVGVMPQGFDYPRGTQVWIPLAIKESSHGARLVSQPLRLVNMIARLKPGVGRVQFDSEMGRLSQLIYAEYPKEFASAGFLTGFTILAAPLQERITGDLKPALLVLSGAVGLVLLIACANIANLLLARTAARQREIAVRLALGSGRGRVVRQVLTESLAMALPGGIAGILIAVWAVEILDRWKPAVLDRYPAISVDVATLAFTLGTTALTALLFGLAPAFAASGIRVQDALKAASLTQSGARGATRLRRSLVVAELGVSLVLLIGAGLLARSFLNLARADLGFRPANLLTFRVRLTGERYASGGQQIQFYADVLERLRRLPVVRAAAVSTDLPLGGEHPYQGMAYQIAGQPPVPEAQQPHANITIVDRDFFRTLGIPLRDGRLFGVEDNDHAADAIVVNEAFARAAFSGEDAVGRTILLGPNTPRNIAGVVGNVRAGELGAAPEPLVYRCTCQGGNRFLTRMTFIVKTASDPGAVARTVESQIYAVDRERPVYDLKTMEQRLDAALSPQRFNLMLVGAFAAIAIVLAAVGVYGVMSYLVTRRTREIGIRIAMGARREQVVRLVVGESITLTVVAVIVGIGGAWMLTRYLKTMLYGVTPWDTETFALMPLVLAALAISAAVAPALRASRIDPIAALREE